VILDKIFFYFKKTQILQQKTEMALRFKNKKNTNIVTKKRNGVSFFKAKKAQM
jgi:hypothetical protein